FLLDLLLAPRRRALPWTTIGTIAVFPIVWLVYTLVRGPLTLDFRTGNAWWYPYPFLTPHVQPWGYGGVALYSVGIAIAILGLGAIAIGVGRL
ncbi:Pr6Pr family membrane protein, partial [Acinetobacter baumannii]